MKLGTLRVKAPKTLSERKDGRLAVVDDASGTGVLVPEDVAPNLWTAVQDWDAVAPKLQALSDELKAGTAEDTFSIEDQEWMAPMPRTTCWLDGSAYINHIVLVRKARGAEPPETLRTVPLLYQGVSDPLLGPNDDIPVASEDYGIDFEAEVGVILDDVPMGTSAEDALDHVKLLCIMNDVSLRGLIPGELKRGFGFLQGKPPTAFAPFVITPDEIGDAWKDGRIHLPLRTDLNGERFGDPEAGPEMFFGFQDLIAHAAKTRPLPAGTVLGSGTVSNEDTSRGSSCLAEKRMLEIIEDGEAKTPFMRFGDRVRIRMLQGERDLFGTIDQQVVQYTP